MEHHNINNMECTILWELHIYSFLCVSHLMFITGKSKSYLHESLGRLKRFGYIRSFTVNVATKARTEAVYYLSDMGADFLITHKAFASDIHIPVGAAMATRDYFHRYYYIWACIALRLHAKSKDIEIEFLRSYFSKSGSSKARNLKAQTYIPLEGKGYFVVDGLLKTRNMLMIIELYNDHSINRILGSLSTSAKAIGLGTPGQVVNMKTNPQILAVFTHLSTLKKVVKTLKNNEHFRPPLSKLFFFCTVDALQAEITNAKDIDGIPIKFH